MRVFLQPLLLILAAQAAHAGFTAAAWEDATRTLAVHRAEADLVRATPALGRPARLSAVSVLLAQWSHWLDSHALVGVSGESTRDELAAQAPPRERRAMASPRPVLAQWQAAARPIRAP